MKKFFLAAALAALMVAQVLPGHAAVNKSATILLPTPLAGTGNSGNIGTFDCLPNDASCDKGPLAKAARCLYVNAPTVAQDSSSGKIGYVIAINGETSFTLAANPAGSADMDVTFYKNLPACQDSPTAYPANTKSAFAKFGTGPESGAIPAGTKFAIVTSFAAVNAGFTFTAS